MTAPQNSAEGLEKREVAEGYARPPPSATREACGRSGFSSASAPGTAISPRRAFTKNLSLGLLESPDLSNDNLLFVTYVQLLCGDNAKAVVALLRIPREASNPVYVISLAAAADLAGTIDVRRRRS